MSAALAFCNCCGVSALDEQAKTNNNNATKDFMFGAGQINTRSEAVQIK
jgi:hypothetical protein